MVREANVKQANAEKQLKEALGKVSTHHSTTRPDCLPAYSEDFCFLSSDRRPTGGGSGPEDARALLPDLPGG